MDDIKRKKISAEEFVRMVAMGELCNFLTRNENTLPVTALEIDGDVFLTGTIELPLRVVDCVFNGKFMTSDWKCLKEVDFSHSIFKGTFSIECAEFDDLSLDSCTFVDDFMAESAVINSFFLAGANFHEICNLDQAVAESVVFSNVSFFGEVRIWQSSFSDVSLTDPKLARLIELSRQGIKIPYAKL